MHVLSGLYDLAYPSSYGFTGSIESTTSRISSLSNRNPDNTRSVTVIVITNYKKSTALKFKNTFLLVLLTKVINRVFKGNFLLDVLL